MATQIQQPTDEEKDAAAISKLPRGGDISHRALEIARAIDRLTPGFTYTVEIRKPETNALDWRVLIVRQEKIQVLTLTYNPE